MKKIKLAFITMCLLFVGVNIMMQAQGDPKEKEYDYILVLGTQLNGKEPSPMLDERIKKAYNDYTLGISDKIIASGRQAPNEEISEALAIKNRLVELGVPEEDILLEENSSRTRENLIYSFEEYGEKDTKMLVVSNQFHLWRVELLAKDIGVEIDTDGAKTPDSFKIKYYIREYAALFKFALEKVGII